MSIPNSNLSYRHPVFNLNVFNFLKLCQIKFTMLPIYIHIEI